MQNVYSNFNECKRDLKHFCSRLLYCCSTLVASHTCPATSNSSKAIWNIFNYCSNTSFSSIFVESEYTLSCKRVLKHFNLLKKSSKGALKTSVFANNSQHKRSIAAPGVSACVRRLRCRCFAEGTPALPALFRSPAPNPFSFAFK